MSATPRRRFWLLAALVLPTLNVAAIAVFLFGGGDGSPIVPVICIAAEFALLGWLLARDGLAGGRLATWLAAGTASTVAATFGYAFAAFLLWMAIVSAGVPGRRQRVPVLGHHGQRAGRLRANLPLGCS